MKPKLILCLARIFISLVVALAALPAGAVSTWTQLNPHDLNHQRLSFTIRTEKRADGVYFLVIIESKSATLSPFLQANLTVLDGKKQIVSCAVEKSQHDNIVLYEFTVSSNYLAESQFTFGNMAEASGHPMPAGDFYWFYLDDFATPGRSINVADIKITFAHPPVTPTASTYLPGTPKPYAPGPTEHGALSNIMAGHIAALTVTWADPKRFKNKSQTQAFLRDLLTSTNEGNWPDHIWSYLDGVPSVVATAEHTAGKQGVWVIWCSPSLDWLYQDKNGIQWWGMWNYDAPKPKSLPPP